MKYTPVSHNPFDNPAKRAARAAGGGVQTTAPFPEKPEGYEFYGPTDNPTGGTPGFGAAELPSYEAAPQDAGNPSVLGKIGSGMVEGFGHWLSTPGETMSGPEQVQPEVPGQWSEEDQYRQNLAQAAHTQRQTDFGGETALNLFGTSAPFVPKGSIGVAGGRPPAAKEYPLASRDEWHGEANYEQTGGQLSYMTPDEFLKNSRPLKIDETSRENIDLLKQHILEGKTLDPLQLYGGGKEDGRHRAIAAKELGIDRVPVINFRPTEPAKPFYSAVERAIAETPQPRASGEQWAATLRNRPGVKPEELDYLGLNEWLSEQKGPVTKQQVLDHVRGNQVQLQEVMKGEQPELNIDQVRQMSASGQPFHAVERANPENVASVTLDNGQLLPWAEKHPDQFIFRAGSFEEAVNRKVGTKFSSYTLPGGENYREMLLTMPEQPATFGVFQGENQVLPRHFASAQEAREAARDMGLSGKSSIRQTNDPAQSFTNSHWDEPNVLAHVRFDDRVIDGKKTLHIAEIQSDWHQTAKKKGYYSEGGRHFIVENPRSHHFSQSFDTRPEAEAYQKTLPPSLQDSTVIRERLSPRAGGVPDAPFKTTWPELAFKRMLRYASENGYEKISWDPGEVQAARYDLSKQLSKIEFEQERGAPDSYHIYAYDKSGNEVITQQSVPSNELPNIVGKEMAQKIVDHKYPEGEFTGLDLKVGGEGMKGFYDQILPAAVNKLVKKHGARVDRGSVEIAERNKGPFTLEGNGPWVIRNREGEFVADFNNRQKAEQTLDVLKKPRTQSVHTLDITPSLRKSVMEQGFPQFAAGGRVAHKNINHNPTEAQKEAGNYAKDHISIHGLDITIENAKGKDRKGVGKDGKAWSVKMPAHYGYIKRTEGADGDHVDCYIGPDTNSARVFVVNQVDADKKDFDEHKCMIGFSSRHQAQETYKKGFSDGRGHERIGHIVEMSIEQFKGWLKNGTKDVAKHTKASVKYSRGMPHSRCGICEFYSNHACTKVKGSIDPQMWCSLFKKKQGRASGGRIGYEDGGSPMRTAGFPEQPEGYEFFGPDDKPEAIPGFAPEGIPSFEASPPQIEGPHGIFAPSKYGVEHGMEEAQTGKMDAPEGLAPRIASGEVQLSDSGEWYDTKTKQMITEERVTPRPGMSPLSFDPSGKPTLVMPKVADIAGGIVGGPVPGGAGKVLGAGLARKIPEKPGLLPAAERGMEKPYGTETETAEATTSAPTAALQPGGIGGAESLATAQRSATEAAGAVRPIENLPSQPLVIGGEYYVPGPIERVHNVAAQYMKDAGLPYEPLVDYAPVSVPRAKSIARQFEEMPHDPNNPEVKASYDAMAKETIAQLEALQKSGLKIEFIKPRMKDPYYDSPRLAAKDVRDNNHLWVFPTELGFGTENAIRDNPLLAQTGIVIDGHNLMVNDAFRIVHDFFGHLKDGVGFRAAGEENAWRSHSRMYSPLARKAMTTETRGQNSWLNYGPHGEKNRTAKSDQTVYADQKIGLLPDWVVSEGAVPYKAPAPEMSERYPQAGAFETLPRDRGPGTFDKKVFTEEEKRFSKVRDKVREEMGEDYPRYFDPEKRFDVDPKNYPTETITTRDAIPAKEATIEKYRKLAESPEAAKRLMDAYKRGKTMPGARHWYAMGQLEKEFIAELGEEAGRAAFKDRFGVSMAALTGGLTPEQNLLASQFANVTRGKGAPYPTEGHQVPYPSGGGKYGITGGLKLHGRMMEEGVGAANPKRHNFAYNFAGHENIATIDEQMSRLFDPKMSLPPGDSYGVYEKALARLAKKAGVSAREFQEVAWAGAKIAKEVGYVPHPMIETVNRAIERTHRLTGMPRAEIVRRGLVRGEIPIYGKATIPATSVDSNERSSGGKVRLTPIAHNPFETKKAIRRAIHGD